MRKQISMLLATMLSLQTTSVAFAAPAKPAIPAAAPAAATQVVKEQYSIQVVNGVLQFVKNGKVVREEKLLNTDIKLTNSLAGGLAVQVVDASGKPRRFTLGNQLALSISGKMNSLQVTEKVPAAANIALATESKIEKVTVSAPASVAVAGAVSVLNVTAKDASVEVAKTAKTEKVTTVAPGAISGVPSNKVEVNNKPTTPPSNSGSSGGGSSSDDHNRPSLADSYKIERIEPSNMQVKVTLNKPTSEPLPADAFAILCDGSGKDMTILDVTTDDRQVYYLRTASYNDNSYFLSIRFSDGSMINKNFVTSLVGPEILSEKITRTSETSAKFNFNADAAGKLYYLIQPKASVARAAIWDGKEEPTIAQVKAKGTEIVMNQYQNEITIDGLQAGIGYVVYFVAEDGKGQTTPLKYLDISETVYTPPAQGEYQITDIKAFNDMSGFDQVHNWFEVTLNKPVSENLTAENFTITCPAHKDVKVGEITSKDATTYTVKVEKNTVLKDNNTYTINIKFADGTVASKDVFVDFKSPELRGIKVIRTGNDTAELSFTTTESGKIYWKIMQKSEIPEGGAPKDPQVVMSANQTADIKAGASNTVNLTGVTGSNPWVCFVAEDERGNHEKTYDYKEIPKDITDPDSGQTPDVDPAKQLKIDSVTAKETQHFAYGETHLITVVFGETPPDIVLSKNDIVIKGPNGTQLSGNQLGDTSLNDRTGSVYTLKKLDPGTYTFEVTMNGKTGSKEFTIN